MESQPQNPEFKINPENFHPCSRPMNIIGLWHFFWPYSFGILF